MKNLFDRARLFFSKDKEFRSALYRIMGFCPHNIDLYRTAFAHKSHEYRSKKTGNKPLNNERLEFLGDAVLETVVSHIVYRQYPNKREGFLTNTRSKIVSRESLGKLAKELGIDRLIQSQTHGRTHNSYLEGNSFEALMGAIYLDRGFRYAFQFIEKRIIGAVLDLDMVANKEVNFKSKLLEWKQKNRIHLDFVDSVSNSASTTSPSFHTSVVIEGIPAGEGKGFSKKESHQAAAKDALTQMRRDAAFLDAMFRAKEKRTAMGAEEFFALPHIAEIDEQIAQERDTSKQSRNDNRAERKDNRGERNNNRGERKNEKESSKSQRNNSAKQKEERNDARGELRNERKSERENSKIERESAKSDRKNEKQERNERKERSEKPERDDQNQRKNERDSAKKERENSPKPKEERNAQRVEKTNRKERKEEKPAAVRENESPKTELDVATTSAEAIATEQAATIIPVGFEEMPQLHSEVVVETSQIPEMPENVVDETLTVSASNATFSETSQSFSQESPSSTESLQQELDHLTETADKACDLIDTLAVSSSKEFVVPVGTSAPLHDAPAKGYETNPTRAMEVAEETQTTIEQPQEVAEQPKEAIEEAQEVTLSATENADPTPKASEQTQRPVRSEQEKKRARRQNKRQSAADYTNTTLPPAEQSHRAAKAERKQQEQAEQRKEEQRKRQVQKAQQELTETFKIDLSIDDFPVVETAAPSVSETNEATSSDEKCKNNRSRGGRRGGNSRRRGSNRNDASQQESSNHEQASQTAASNSSEA